MIKLILPFLFLPFLLMAQPPADRYLTDLFSNVTETNDLQFSTNVPQPNPGGGFYETITGLPLNVDEFSTTPVNLYMDIFEPTGDTLSKRPLIIIAFGGGFVTGSREHWSIRALCQELAKRGFVTAAIDYRLGMNVFDSDLANRAVYRGLQDIRSAVRFFRADAAGANIYKIAPDKIFLGGHSAGAFCALHNAYLDKETERPLSTYTWTQDGNSVPDQGCLDCAGDNPGYSGMANGTFSLAGALGFTDFIETANDPKSVLFHSTDDDTVPYNSGEPFGSILWLVVGADLPVVYGSAPISTEATMVGLPHEFYSYTDRGHGVHEDSGEQLYDDIIPKIGDWFQAAELQPEPGELHGKETICSATLTHDYQLMNSSGVYFDWQIIGGTFNTMNTNSDLVNVTWDANAADHNLSVIPYSNLDAIGDTAIININFFNSGTNTFTAISNSWSDINNWSLGHIPTPCEDVMLNASGLYGLNINSPAEANSLFVSSTGTLEITVGAELVLHQKSSANAGHALEVDGVIISNGELKVSNVVAGKEILINNNGKIEMKGSGAIGEE